MQAQLRPLSAFSVEPPVWYTSDMTFRLAQAPDGEPASVAKTRPWAWYLLLLVAMAAGFGGGSLTCLAMLQAGVVPTPGSEPVTRSAVIAPSSRRASAELPLSPAGNPALASTFAPRERQEIRLTILNGTRRVGLGSEAASILREAGWAVWVVGTSRRHDVQTTALALRARDERFARAIVASLGLRTAAASLERDPTTDGTLVLGEDFTTALRHPAASPATRSIR